MVKLLNALLLMSNESKNVLELYKQDKSLKNLNDFLKIKPFDISKTSSNTDWRPSVHSLGDLILHIVGSTNQDLEKIAFILHTNKPPYS